MKKEKLITVAIIASVVGAVVGVLTHKSKRRYINLYNVCDCDDCYDDYDDEDFYD